MRVKLEPRANPSRAMQSASPLVAIVLTITLGFALCVAIGKNPLATVVGNHGGQRNTYEAFNALDFASTVVAAVCA